MMSSKSVIALIVCVTVSAPMVVFAASPTKGIGVGSIDVSTLTSSAPKPTVSGLAFGVQTLQLSVRKQGSTAIFYKKNVRVHNDRWKVTLSKKLANGAYDIVLTSVKGFPFTTTPTAVLMVGSRASNTMLTVMPIALLRGGLATANATVPLSYLQVINTGKGEATLRGFWIKQNGSASTQAIIGIMTLDDEGSLTGFSLGNSNAPLFKDNTAFAPAKVTLAAGQMKLFTIKALINSNVSAYSGSQLMIDVLSLDSDTLSVSGSFPIRGTTWTIQ